MTGNAWELESAEGRHARSPDSFWIPPAHQRDRVASGQAVKLLFRFRSGGDEVVERMWVYVRGREGDTYLGTLQSTPQSPGPLGPGTEVRFRAEHIADIDTPPPDYEPA